MPWLRHLAILFALVAAFGGKAPASAARWPQEAWSIVLKLNEPPDAEGRMTVEVRMLVEGAPEGLLGAGQRVRAV